MYVSFVLLCPHCAPVNRWLERSGVTIP